MSTTPRERAQANLDIADQWLNEHRISDSWRVVDMLRDTLVMVLENTETLDGEPTRWLAEHDREVWKAGALRAATMCINEELFARLDGDGFGAVIELPHEEDGRRRRAIHRRGDLPSLIAAIAERPEPEK